MTQIHDYYANPEQLLQAVLNILVWHPHQTDVATINNKVGYIKYSWPQKFFQAEKCFLISFFLCNCHCVGCVGSELHNDSNLKNNQTI